MTLSELALVCKNCKRTGFHGMIVNSLQELQERRESDIRPATKFLDTDPFEQFTHLQSELREVQEELKNIQLCVDVDSTDPSYYENTEKALDEINDLQISAETLKTILEPNKEKRRLSMVKTISKNKKRGYYHA